MSILYFRLKFSEKYSGIFWDLIHLYGMIGSLELPLYMGGRLFDEIRSKPVWVKLLMSSYSELSKATVPQHRTEILVCKDSQSNYGRDEPWQTSDGLILLLCSRAKSTIGILTWWNCLSCCIRIFLGIFLWFSMCVVVNFGYFLAQGMLYLYSVFRMSCGKLWFWQLWREWKVCAEWMSGFLSLKKIFL